MRKQRLVIRSDCDLSKMSMNEFRVRLQLKKAGHNVRCPDRNWFIKRKDAKCGMQG